METGTRIGPYEIREKIGEGGMAAVYKVWHTGLHRFEALKIPHHQELTGLSSQFVQRLLAEARLAAQLHHPHVVTIHNISDADAPVHFFSMDLVVGYDLSVLLERRGHLTLAETLPIVRQVAEALDYAHGRGVIHRDIKPANILLQEVTESGGWLAKVVDFGISRAAEEDGGTRLTKSGMVIGTPEYMSPEQSGNGDPVDYRSDIYSLGIVAYEMLCGHPPFVAGEGVSRMSILMAHVNQVPRPPLEHIPGLPLSANNAVLRALAKHPEERFNSCAEFMKALSGAITVSSPWTTPTTLAAASPVETIVAAAPATAPTIAPAEATAEMATAPPAHDAPIVARPVSRGSVSSKPVSRAPLALLGVGGLLAVGAIIWMNSRPATETDSRPQVSAPATIPTATVAASPSAAPPPTAAPVKAVAMPRPTATAPPQRVVQMRRTEAVAYPRRVTKTSALPAGQQRVQQTGRPWLREVIVAVTYRGPREIARRVVTNRIVKPPLPQVELVGTRVAAPTPRPIKPAAPKRAVRERVKPRRSVRPRRSRTPRFREAPPPQF